MSSLTCLLQVIMGLPAGPKSDVYGAGIVLWELCTQERPNGGELRALRCGADHLGSCCLARAWPELSAMS